MNPKSVWTKADGFHMHARVSGFRGDGRETPAVLVHGLGLSSPLVAPLAERLSERREVYAPDLPGFGDSAKPGRTLAIAELADSLAAWTRAVGLESATYVGNSLGCQILADMAVRHPNLVSRMVLQGPTVDPRARSFRKQFPRWLQNSRSEPRSLGPLSLREYRKCGIRRLMKTFRLMLEDPVEEKLPEVRAPTLVVRGSLDPIVPARWAEEAASLLPRGRLAVIPDAPHSLVYGWPGELAEVIENFLEDETL